MKALCLYGQPRFVESAVSSNCYKEFILNKENVDIYGHAWQADSYLTSSWNKVGEVPGNKNIRDIINEQYHGIKLKLEPSVCFDDKNLNVNNIISQLYSIEESVNLIQDPDKYSFILVGRWDLLLTRFEPINSLKSGYYSTNRHPILADQLIFASPKYLPAFKMFHLKNAPEINKDSFSIEQFKLDYFKKLFSGESIQKHDFVVDLIRN